MKKIKITVMRIACYQDLMEQYENPIEHACDMQVGQVFIADGWRKPEGFCDSAWETISPFPTLPRKLQKKSQKSEEYQRFSLLFLYSYVIII